MSVDYYQRTGRGGAGNFYSQQDINDLTKRSIEDVEAQKSALDPEVYPARRPSEYAHAHSGRGGAGNWYTPESLDLNKPPKEDSLILPTRTAPPSGKLGRGGAGNFSTALADRQKAEEEQALREKREKVSEQTKIDVEMGLRMPERAHIGSIEKRGDIVE